MSKIKITTLLFYLFSHSISAFSQKQKSERDSSSVMIFHKHIDIEIGLNFRYDKPNKGFFSQQSYRFLSHDGDIFTLQVRWKTNTKELPLLATFVVKETSGHFKYLAIIVEHQIRNYLFNHGMFYIINPEDNCI